MPRSITFFDVDGTLIRGYSGYYTTRELIRRKLIKKRRLTQALFYKLISPFYYGDVRRLYEIALSDLAGVPLEQVLQIGREIFEAFLKAKIYQEALDIFERDRRRGNKIILVTSGPYMTIQSLSEFIRADAFFAVGPEIDENNLLQKNLMEPFCFMEGKVEIAQKEAAKEGLSLAECSFYADSIHDLPLLSEVGSPFAVNPDRKLRKKALERGWPILSFGKLLGGK